MRQAGLDGCRQIAKSRELLFQRFGAGALCRCVALGHDRGGHSVFMLPTEHLLAGGAFAIQCGHLYAQFLRLLPSSVDFGVRTIFCRTQMLRLGVALCGSRGLLLLEAPGQGLHFCIQTLAAGLQAIALLGEVLDLLGSLLCELLDFSKTGLGDGQCLLGRIDGRLLCRERLLHALPISREGGPIALQGLPIRRDTGHRVLARHQQGLFPEL